jgi:hypothetical protein
MGGPKAHEELPGLTIRAYNGDILSSGSQPGRAGKSVQPPTRNRKITRLRLLIDIVHGLKGFGKGDFVLTKAGGRDKQNTWEAG